MIYNFLGAVFHIHAHVQKHACTHTHTHACMHTHAHTHWEVEGLWHHSKFSMPVWWHPAMVINTLLLLYVRLHGDCRKTRRRLVMLPQVQRQSCMKASVMPDWFDACLLTCFCTFCILYTSVFLAAPVNLGQRVGSWKLVCLWEEKFTRNAESPEGQCTV